MPPVPQELGVNLPENGFRSSELRLVIVFGARENKLFQESCLGIWSSTSSDGVGVWYLGQEELEGSLTPFFFAFFVSNLKDRTGV